MRTIHRIAFFMMIFSPGGSEVRGVGSTLGVLILGFLCSAARLQAGPPPNDLCQNAEKVPDDGPFPWTSSLVLDVTDATTVGDPGEPSCLPFVSRSIWFTFKPFNAGFYRISVSGDTMTNIRDTVMAIYTSANGCNGPFIEIECNDDGGFTEPNLFKSAIARTLDAQITYYILVWVVGAEPPDPAIGTSLQLRVSRPAHPANDTCAGALEIPRDATFPYLTPVVDTLLATQSLSEPLPLCQTNASAARCVWYRFSPTSTAFYSISTCAGTATTISDTILALYVAPNGCAGPFTLLACNDDGCGLRSDIKATLSGNTDYYIAVWDSEIQPSVAETDLQLRIALPPEAITFPASSLTSTGAVLNGLVRGNGVNTQFWFEWGPSVDYSNRTPLSLLFNTVPSTLTNALLTGLLPDVLYHYRIVATNLNGRAEGEDRSFLRSTLRPEIRQPTIPIGGGYFQFSFSGSPGQIYRVLVSSDLSTWTDAGSAYEFQPGQFLFLENGQPAPQRFYRLLSP